MNNSVTTFSASLTALFSARSSALNYLTHCFQATRFLALALCAALSCSAYADKPGWAGQGKPNAEQKSDHRTEMRYKQRNDIAQAPLLREQFGAGATFFSNESMRALIEYHETGPVTLLQLMEVRDPTQFFEYLSAINSVWEAAGAETRLSKKIMTQLIGDRSFVQVRAIEFPSTVALLEAMRSQEFSRAMDLLFAATTDHTWVVGVETRLPFQLNGSFVDPALQNLDRDDAIALLGDSSSSGSFAVNSEALIDMVVSDSPDPFWMVNLIDFYEEARYADGRDTDLTGAEANEIYGQAIVPYLLAFQSFPSFLMPVDLVLTNDEVEWEEAAIVRYASRDAFLNIFALNPAIGDALIHKDAGVENALVYMSEPAPGPLYGLRYCEILLPYIDFATATVTAEVWGTQGLNPCPQEQWGALDAATIAAEYGVPRALMNGPRYPVVDYSTGFLPPVDVDNRFYGELEMRLLTTVSVSLSDFTAGGAYNIGSVDRDNIWYFVEGRRIYELEDPAGERFIMQTFSQAVDPQLSFEDLPYLGARLTLPAGWSFHTRVLTAPLEVPAVNGIAEVLQDDLANSYQRVP